MTQLMEYFLRSGYCIKRFPALFHPGPCCSLLKVSSAIIPILQQSNLMPIQEKHLAQSQVVLKKQSPN